MLSDIQIAQRARLLPMEDIAARLGLPADALIPYGRDKAKIDLDALPQKEGRGKLILVTAINPTPAGEGKTTTSVGLGDGMALEGCRVCLALREPSLGPVFGVKGGAAGGGYAQVVPMESLNLHFTGDIHAITAANNLLAAMLDNHLYQGNALDIDPDTVSWRRAMDMNDRQLRSIRSGLGDAGGVPRDDGFDITAASEVMATFCMAASLRDLEDRLSRIVVARNRNGCPVTAADLKAAGAMTVLLKDAFRPNLVQTLEHTPVLVHGGPFANIAHGCNSVVATRTALSLADYVVTEAGFGADLGAEKFCDIKCRAAGLAPDAVVLVATVRALKYHGGVAREDLSRPDREAVTRGADNLRKHVENLTGFFRRPVVVAVNHFDSDTEEETEAILAVCTDLHVPAVVCTSWAQGGEGARALARVVIAAAHRDAGPMPFLYETDRPVADKIRRIAQDYYGAGEVELTERALKDIAEIEALGYGGLPVCMAKTQYSLSDKAKLLGRPRGFTLTVRQVRISAGAGFLVALTGRIMTMPGLPPVPAAEAIGLDDHGDTVGLF